MERRELSSDDIKGRCVIWYGNMYFLHIVMGMVCVRVTGIWERVRIGTERLEDCGRIKNETMNMEEQIQSDRNQIGY